MSTELLCPRCRSRVEPVTSRGRQVSVSDPRAEGEPVLVFECVPCGIAWRETQLLPPAPRPFNELGERGPDEC